MREGAQKVFLDFFGFAKDAPQRSRPGIYSAKIFGREGRRVQVIITGAESSHVNSLTLAPT